MTFITLSPNGAPCVRDHRVSLTLGNASVKIPGVALIQVVVRLVSGFSATDVHSRWLAMGWLAPGTRDAAGDYCLAKFSC